MAFERHQLTAGVDVSSAQGTFSERFTYVGSSPTREREVGGTQRIAGLFVQDAADLGAGVRLVASVRGDRVWNVDGARVLRAVDAGTDLSDSTIDYRATTQLT